MPYYGKTAIANLLYTKPLYNYCSNDKLNILVIGANENATTFIDCCMQLCVFIEDKHISLCIACDKQDVKELNKKYKTAKNYSDIEFEFSSDVKDFSEYDYVFVSNDSLSENAALARLNEDNCLLIAYCADANETESENLIPICVNKKPQINEQLERLAYNLHFVWSSPQEDAQTIWNTFNDSYNYDSSILSALSIKYKLQCLGIEPSEDTLEAYRAVADDCNELLDIDNIKEKLSRLEQDRWAIEKLIDGWSGLPFKDGRYDFSNCITNNSWKNSKKKIHPCIADFDELGEISDQMNEYFKRLTDTIDKTALLKKITELEKMLGENNSLYNEFYYLAENVLNFNKISSNQIQAVAKSITHSVRGIKDDNLIEQIMTELFPFIMYNCNKRFEYLNDEQIEKLPFILSYNKDFTLVLPLNVFKQKQIFSAVIEYGKVKSQTASGSTIFCYHINSEVISPSGVEIGKITDGAISLNSTTRPAEIKDGDVLDKSGRKIASLYETYIDVNYLPLINMLKAANVIFIGDNSNADAVITFFKELNFNKPPQVKNSYTVTDSCVVVLPDNEQERSNFTGSINNLNDDICVYFESSEKKFSNASDKLSWLDYVPTAAAHLNIEAILNANKIVRDRYDSIAVFNEKTRDEIFSRYFKTNTWEWNNFVSSTMLLRRKINSDDIRKRIVADINPNSQELSAESCKRLHIIPAECRANLTIILNQLKKVFAVEEIAFSECDDCAELMLTAKPFVHNIVDELVFEKSELISDICKIKQLKVNSDNSVSDYIADYDRDPRMVFIKDNLEMLTDSSTKKSSLLSFLKDNLYISEYGDKYYFRSSKIKSLFEKEGNVLENFLFSKAIFSGYFDDVIPGCQIKYNDDSGKPQNHEIDCILTCNSKALLVECKNKSSLTKTEDGYEEYEQIVRATEKFHSDNIIKCIVHFDKFKSSEDTARLDYGNNGIITINDKNAIRKIDEALKKIAHGNAVIDENGIFIR